MKVRPNGYQADYDRVGSVTCDLCGLTFRKDTGIPSVSYVTTHWLLCHPRRYVRAHPGARQVVAAIHHR